MVLKYERIPIQFIKWVHLFIRLLSSHSIIVFRKYKKVIVYTAVNTIALLLECVATCDGRSVRCSATISRDLTTPWGHRCRLVQPPYGGGVTAHVSPTTVGFFGTRVQRNEPRSSLGCWDLAEQHAPWLVKGYHARLFGSSKSLWVKWATPRDRPSFVRLHVFRRNSIYRLYTGHWNVVQ